jgi:hypothetical protein
MLLQTATLPAESVGLGGFCFRSAQEPCTRPVDTRRRREGSLAKQPVAAEIRNSNAAGSSARISGPVSNNPLGMSHAFELLKLNASAGRWEVGGGGVWGVAKERVCTLHAVLLLPPPNTLNRNPVLFLQSFSPLCRPVPHRFSTFPVPPFIEIGPSLSQLFKKSSHYRKPVAQ